MLSELSDEDYNWAMSIVGGYGSIYIINPMNPRDQIHQHYEDSYPFKGRFQYLRVSNLCFGVFYVDEHDDKNMEITGYAVDISSDITPKALKGKIVEENSSLTMKFVKIHCGLYIPVIWILEKTDNDSGNITGLYQGKWFFYQRQYLGLFR